MIDDDDFLERLRGDARQLRFEPNGPTATRIAARVRERIAAEQQTGVAQVLSRWFRPFIASLAALGLVALLSLQWIEQTTDPGPASLDSLTSTQSVDISVAGDTFSVE